MANPQVEDGSTKIANELLEAIIRIPMSDYEHRIFWLIIRKTYGWSKKIDWISNNQISEMTGILPNNVSRTLKKLIAKNMVIKESKRFGINKDYETWIIGKLSNQITKPILSKLSKEIINNDMEKVPEQVSNNEGKLSNQIQTENGNVSKQIQECIQTDIKIYPNRCTTKYTIQNILLQNKYIEILNYWNNKNIIVHNSLTDKLKNQIKIALKKYKKEEVFLAINNYSTIVKDDGYFFNVKWTLEIFLKQSNALPYFLNDGIRWINYLGRKDKAINKSKPTGRKYENY